MGEGGGGGEEWKEMKGKNLPIEIHIIWVVKLGLDEAAPSARKRIIIAYTVGIKTEQHF